MNRRAGQGSEETLFYLRDEVTVLSSCRLVLVVRTFRVPLQMGHVLALRPQGQHSQSWAGAGGGGSTLLGDSPRLLVPKGGPHIHLYPLPTPQQPAQGQGQRRDSVNVGWKNPTELVG